MDYQAFGDEALLLEFGNQIDPEINRKVVALYQLLMAVDIEGVHFLTPAYTSLLIHFDNGFWNAEDLWERINLLQDRQEYKWSETTSRLIDIPVCYEDPFAMDMDSVMQKTGLSRKEVVHIHTATPYQVYMLGFLPGFAYMGVSPEALDCARRETPRLEVPAQSVGLAGKQTGIYPVNAPGGWQIIGRTPFSIFEPMQAEPMRLRPGDQINFRAIKAKQYEIIEEKVRNQSYKWHIREYRST